MKRRVIDKSAVAGFIDDLRQEYTVFAPVERDGLLNFEPLRRAEDARLDFANSKRPPKEILFPRSETLFSYENGKVTSVPLPQEQTVVLGIRPCDAASLLLLDVVFDTPECEDPYYVRRRQNTVLIGLGCNRPQPTCFCTALGRGPFATEGLDLLFTDIGESYVVESITDRGEELLASHGQFRDATAAELDIAAGLAANAAKAISGPNIEGIKEKLDAMYDDGFWNELAQRCLGCAVCSYLCPTCHCFDIVDEAVNGNGRRVRNWDTCQFSQFTAHASGHNPRPSSKERMRQRVMHKFRYFVANHGQVACVGCGRCVRECPVNLDIRAVIKDVGQALERAETRTEAV